MLKAITEHIEDNTSFVIGTDLFPGHRDDDAPDTCIVVREAAGGIPNFDLPDSVAAQIQIVCRSNSFFTARANAYTIHALLHGKSGIVLPEVVSGDKFVANTISAVQIPYYLGQDKRNLYEYSQTFIFRIQDEE